MASPETRSRVRGYALPLWTLCFFLVFAGQAAALTVVPVGPNGAPITEFYYTVQEDQTWDTKPGVQTGNTQAVGFHRSHSPVVASGDETTASRALPADKRYFVSVLPKSGYTNGGAPVAMGQSTVTVLCNALPLPTAQITVFVHEDNHPCNNAPDLPQEGGLAGFKVTLEEPAGRYGMSGGPVSQDAYGNMIGTDYQVDADGNLVLDGEGNPIPISMGDMYVLTDEDGLANIKHLSPGKYGLIVIPPPGTDWEQTSTIEGTLVVDAWVQAGEPPYFQEFGPPGFHATFGFVHPTNDQDVLNGATTVTGQVVNLHTSRPPQTAFFPGQPLANVWVGLNDGITNGQLIWAQPADVETGEFSIPNVPAGTYQIVFWDRYLNNIFAFHTINVVEGEPQLDLGQIPVFRWFGGMNNYVFNDANSNGMWDAGETGLSDQNVNLRWRDGTIYQAMLTDLEGTAPFEEVFPFFNWLVAEVDFARYKPTGVTVAVDDGGQIDPADPWSQDGRLNPQPQPENGNQSWRTEVGAVLTQAFQVFLGQTNAIYWGKKQYQGSENGGIAGMVIYATTRAEKNPRQAVIEPWEPGLPRVQVTLYADGDVDKAPYGNFPGAEDVDWNRDGVCAVPDGVLDDVNRNGLVDRADQDNYPLGWSTGGAKGWEDIDQNGNGAFEAGDAIQIAWTDSWDDTPPTGCVGDPFVVHGVPTDCYDGLRNFNQVRPGVFDGGYAFNSYVPGGVDSGATPMGYLPNTTYIVQTSLPAGYKLVKEEDKNVDFGDTYELLVHGDPSIYPPPCCGGGHTVPAELALFPGVPIDNAGAVVPLCDMRQVKLEPGRNAAADFFLFTEAPVAANVTGMILDDLSNEWDFQSPTFGEKYAPPWVPVAFLDFAGNEITRVYADEWGMYNALLPSTYAANRPMPSGMAPNMMQVCINAAFMPDPANPGQQIPDPYHDQRYSTFCYVFQYMPGATTYLDTPVLPTSAHTGGNQYPLDCEFPDGVPVIKMVDSPEGGPYVSGAGDSEILIYAMGQTEVRNPFYDGPNGTQPINIFRDYGFGGTQGFVTLNGDELEVISWEPGLIKVLVPGGSTSGQLLVTRADTEHSTIAGITLHVGSAGAVHRVMPGQSIQAAIDAAARGDLILVQSGEYKELVILYKDVILQGYGAGSTTINAVKSPVTKLDEWRAKVTALYDAGEFDILPGQTLTGEFGEFALFNTEEGPGVIVLNKNAGFTYARVDGFKITGADHGGGIFVNGYADNLNITNNFIINNSGFYGGGIRVGHPGLVLNDEYVDALNDDIIIDHNRITMNGGLKENGGGISICTGADGYQITKNYICGNFTTGNGAGIGHAGRSDGGEIKMNVVSFNENYNQGGTAAGAGISIRGAVPIVGGLTDGAGSVAVVGNLIQGNEAGTGDGGGVDVAMINGTELLAEDPYRIELSNNAIVNNLAGLAGGGVSVFDAVDVSIVNNTIANNDSTATASLAFGAGPLVSNPQVAGVVYRRMSNALYDALGEAPPQDAVVLDNPVLLNNIIRGNRSFTWDGSLNNGLGGLLPDVAAGQPAVINDLGVVGLPEGSRLDPMNCVLGDLNGYDGSNINADPMFVWPYHNGAMNWLYLPETTTALVARPAFDEGGNFIDLRFGPLTPAGDYTLANGSPAENAGAEIQFAVEMSVASDFFWDVQGQNRPAGGGMDIGADELSSQPVPVSAGGLTGNLDIGGFVPTPVTPGTDPGIAPPPASGGVGTGSGGGGGGGCFIESIL